MEWKEGTKIGDKSEKKKWESQEGKQASSVEKGVIPIILFEMQRRRAELLNKKQKTEEKIQYWRDIYEAIICMVRG